MIRLSRNNSFYTTPRYPSETVLKWNNLSLSVPDNQNPLEQKYILNNVSGYAKTGG